MITSQSVAGERGPLARRLIVIFAAFTALEWSRVLSLSPYTSDHSLWEFSPYTGGSHQNVGPDREAMHTRLSAAFNRSLFFWAFILVVLGSLSPFQHVQRFLKPRGSSKCDKRFFWQLQLSYADVQTGVWLERHGSRQILPQNREHVFVNVSMLNEYCK